MLKKFSLACAMLSSLASQSFGEIMLSFASSSYSQTFDSLASTGTTGSTLPNDWAFSETGTGANTTYGVGTGSGTAGNTYSFGSTASSDRAFGTLQSGSVVPTIGAQFRNSDAVRILTALSFSYTGEQWRLGAAGRADRLDFEYSLNATSLSSGTWVAVDALDFSSPVTTGTVGLRDGNQPANRTSVSSTISTLSIAAGTTFWIRWTDFDISGAEDGLAIDDFSANATFAAVPEPTSMVLVGLVGLAGVAVRTRRRMAMKAL